MSTLGDVALNVALKDVGKVALINVAKVALNNVGNVALSNDGNVALSNVALNTVGKNVDDGRNVLVGNWP